MKRTTEQGFKDEKKFGRKGKRDFSWKVQQK